MKIIGAMQGMDVSIIILHVIVTVLRRSLLQIPHNTGVLGMNLVGRYIVLKGKIVWISR